MIIIIPIFSGQGKTVREYAFNLFKYAVKPNFTLTKQVLFLFDDTKDRIEIDLKKTAGKRYTINYDEIELTPMTLINDWEKVIKSPVNKAKLKKILFAEFIQSGIAEELQPGQSLFLNGTDQDGSVLSLKKNDQNYVEFNSQEFSVRCDESDSKIYFAMKQFYKKGYKNFLVYSQDTDVKMLSLYWSAFLGDVNITIKYGNSLAASYFKTTVVREYFKKEFDLKSHDQQVQHAKSLLKCYNFFGSDACPGFNGISNGFALKIFHEICKTKIPIDEHDFLELILTVYETKHITMKRLFCARPDSMTIDEKILHTRY